MVADLGLCHRNGFEQRFQTIGPFELFGGRCTIIFGGKAIPAAQLAIAGNQSLAYLQHRAIVSLDHAHHGEAQCQFARCLNHIGEAFAR